MIREVITSELQTRCYECSHPKVDMVCHHCGRAICENDGPATIPDGEHNENPEYADLGLSQVGVGEKGVHCKDCIHYVKSYKWLFRRSLWAGSIGLLILLIALLAEQNIGIVIGLLTIAGGCAVGYLGITWQRNKYDKKALKNRPPFPVIGKFNSLHINEYIKGNIHLDSDGKYSTTVEKPTGKTMMNLQFTPLDLERFDKFCAKYHLGLNDDQPFHAGFLVYEGRSNLIFKTTEPDAPNLVNTIVLLGKISEQPFFDGNGNGKDTHWRIDNNYNFLLNDDKESLFPVQIVTSLVQEGAKKSIELVLQLSSEIYKLPVDFSTARIDEFVLNAPQELGKVEVTEPSAIVGTTSESNDETITSLLQTTWKGLDFNSGKRFSRSKSFYVRFENTVEPSTILTGRVRLRFTGNLSGISGVSIFSPLGTKRNEIRAQRYTYLDIDYNIDLGGLRFQEMISAEERLNRDGIVPDYRVITALTDAISSEGFYIKRVIENPPRTSKAGAHIIYRYWDIAGRYYDGVYPNDFHLVISGEEVYGGKRSITGKMRTDISVQGAVTNEDMRNKVYNQRDRLVEIIKGTLDDLPEDISSNLHPISDAAYDSEETLFESAETQPPPQPEGNGKLETLKEKMDKLDEALLLGRITETLYREMKERFEKEFEMHNS